MNPALCSLEGLRELRGLSDVDATGCNLQPGTLHALEGCASSLTGLHLYWNTSLGSIEGVQQYRGLTSLNVGLCGLVGPDALQPLAGLQSLQYLNMSRNAVSSLECLSALTSLTSVVADRCSLEGQRLGLLGEWLVGCRSTLRNIDVRDNPQLERGELELGLELHRVLLNEGFKYIGFNAWH